MKEFNFLDSELNTMKENGTWQEHAISSNQCRDQLSK